MSDPERIRGGYHEAFTNEDGGPGPGGRPGGFASDAEFGAKGAAAHAAPPVDLKTADETGVRAEIDNIAMYGSFLVKDLPGDAAALFEELKRAPKTTCGPSEAP